jgi:hypothetical protein
MIKCVCDLCGNEMLSGLSSDSDPDAHRLWHHELGEKTFIKIQTVGKDLCYECVVKTLIPAAFEGRFVVLRKYIEDLLAGRLRTSSRGSESNSPERSSRETLNLG